jgi:hypothetical protein
MHRHIPVLFASDYEDQYTFQEIWSLIENLSTRSNQKQHNLELKGYYKDAKLQEHST